MRVQNAQTQSFKGIIIKLPVNSRLKTSAKEIKLAKMSQNANTYLFFNNLDIVPTVIHNDTLLINTKSGSLDQDKLFTHLNNCLNDYYGKVTENKPEIEVLEDKMFKPLWERTVRLKDYFQKHCIEWEKITDNALPNPYQTIIN